MSERMDEYFSVFNNHKNNACERANAEYIAQLGQDTFDQLIAPLHKSGIMEIFKHSHKWEIAIWISLCTAYVNEGCNDGI